MILLCVDDRFVNSYQDSFSNLEFSTVVLMSQNGSIIGEVSACEPTVVCIFHVLKGGSRLKVARQSTGEGSGRVANVHCVWTGLTVPVCAFEGVCDIGRFQFPVFVLVVFHDQVRCESGACSK